MKRKYSSLFVVLATLLLMSCEISLEDDSVKPVSTPTPITLQDSELYFTDGFDITKRLADGVYTNIPLGKGDGKLTFSSSVPSVATINASSGEVTFHTTGSTVIQVSKAATSTHKAVSAQYGLNIVLKFPSTITFEDNYMVYKMLVSGNYTNIVGGIGDGALTFSSNTPTVATVNATTGEVTLKTVGETIITVNKASTEVFEATAAQYTLDIINTPIMTTIPAGVFQRDSDSGNKSKVSSFRISTYEITWTEFAAVSDYYQYSLHNSAASQVNWYSALVFCNRLSMIENLTPAYTIGGSTDPDDWGAVPQSNNATWNMVSCNWSASGYRLPTEMEWMWAAMGATSDRSNGNTGTGINTKGYTKGYAGSVESGSEITNIGNFAWYSTNNSGYYDHTIGTKIGNELGLYDMSGSIAEWCWDWYAPYATGELINYHGATTSPNMGRVIRGGSAGENASFCSIASRNFWEPVTKMSTNGLRVVRP